MLRCDVLVNAKMKAIKGIMKSDCVRRSERNRGGVHMRSKSFPVGSKSCFAFDPLTCDGREIAFQAGQACFTSPAALRGSAEHVRFPTVLSLLLSL